jgi:serine protease Do
MSTTTRGLAVALVASGLALTLGGCNLIPGAAGADTPAQPGEAVSFDHVQQAVIQLEARGTFVDPEYGGYEGAGRGSGFIISEDGLAVTNNHVVVGAGTIDVWRGGDQSDTLDARVLGASECLDIAVVQLEKDDYPYFAWHKGDITTGTDVYAAGFPLGDPTFTMTRGIVSKADIEGDTAWASIDSIIEHDARIRPGNSGGPLVDASGRVVGVNYAGEETHDTNYAIHRDEVQDVIEQLAAGETVLSLGINGQGLYGEDGGLGIWVSSVAAGSAADKAGIEPGDLITRLQGVSVGTDGTMREYCDVLRTHGTDATLDIELFRPADETSYRGQVNGDEPIAAVTVVGGGGGGQPSGDFVDVVDASESVSVQVPAEWDDVDRSGMTDDAGNQWARVMASTDLAQYNSGWDVSGVTVMASPTAGATIGVDNLLASTREGVTADGCASDGTQDFADGYHTGKYEYFTGCGSTGADFISIAALADDGGYLIYVLIQVVSDSDLDAVDRIVGSFIAGF